MSNKKAIPDNLSEEFFSGKSAFFEEDSNEEKETQKTATKPNPPAKKRAFQKQKTIVSKPVNHSVNPVVNTPVDTSEVLAKVKGFYITEQQDEDIDIAVKKLSNALKGKLPTKIDRSTVLRLIIAQANITSDDSIKKLANLLTSQLIRQLTGK